MVGVGWDEERALEVFLSFLSVWVCGGLTNPELHWPFVSLYSMGMREAFLDMD